MLLLLLFFAAAAAAAVVVVVVVVICFPRPTVPFASFCVRRCHRAVFSKSANVNSQEEKEVAFTVKCRREGEACLVAALSHFRAASGSTNAPAGLATVVGMLDKALDECLTLSEGGSFGF